MHKHGDSVLVRTNDGVPYTMVTDPDTGIQVRSYTESRTTEGRWCGYCNLPVQGDDAALERHLEKYCQVAERCRRDGLTLEQLKALPVVTLAELKAREARRNG